MVRLATAKLRIRKRPSGSIGWRATASRTMKRAKQTTPTTIGTQTIGSPQPCAGCSIRAKVGPPSPIAESRIPSQSMPRKASSSRLSSTAWRVSTTVAAISGMLTQKIARQEARPIRAPPPAGPSTVAIPVQAVQVPTALPRASPSKVEATIASEPGTSSAPATPCRARAPIRNSDARRDRAEDRGRAEGDQPDHEHPAAAELVAEAAADEEQGDERQRVGLDHPLLAGEADVEPVADRRQGDVDDGAVEEDDGRAEDRRDQRQTLLAGHADESTSRARPARAAAGIFSPDGGSDRLRWRVPPELAAAATLRSRRRRGESCSSGSDRVGASWRTRYDGLRLNTPGWMSTQPGYRAEPPALRRVPVASRAGSGTSRTTPPTIAIDVRFGTQARVAGVPPTAGVAGRDRGRGPCRRASAVIATGFDHDPDLPDWPGRDGFSRRAHPFAAPTGAPSRYRGPRRPRRRRRASTGSEVAALLAQGGAGTRATWPAGRRRT